MQTKSSIFVRKLSFFVGINLLLNSVAQQPEGKLIAKMNAHFNFDHNIFLFESTVGADGFRDPTENYSGVLT